MPLIHGNQGKVFLGGTEAVDVMQWELHEEVRLHAYTSSATGPVPGILAGRKQLRGSCHLLLDTGFDALGALSLGSKVTLKLHLDSSRFFEITGMVFRLEILKSKRSGEPDQLKFEFVNIGGWIRPAWN